MQCILNCHGVDMIKIEQTAPQTFTIYTACCELTFTIFDDEEKDEELGYIKCWLDNNIDKANYHLKPVIGRVINFDQVLNKQFINDIIVRYTLIFETDEDAMHFKLTWE